MNKVADKILEFKKGKVTFFDGTYEEFQEWKKDKQEKNESKIEKTNMEDNGKAEQTNSKKEYLKK